MTVSLCLIVDGDVDVKGDVGVVVPVQPVVVSLLRGEQLLEVKPKESVGIARVRRA